MDIVGKRVERSSHRLRGRRGGLRDMLNMPIEIGFEICKHLDPIDILHLSQSTKQLRALLMSLRNISVWRTSRKNIEGLPECPSYLSEPAYANLVFSTHCHNCLKNNCKTILWQFVTRYCKKCKQRLTVSGKALRALEHESPVLRDHKDWLNRMNIRGTSFYHLPQVDLLDERLVAVGNDEVALSQFHEAQTALTKEIDEHAKLCSAWLQEQVSARESILSKRRDERMEEIRSRLRERGWENRLHELYGMHPPLIYIARQLSDRDWQKMVDWLEPNAETMENPVDTGGQSYSHNTGTSTANAIDFVQGNASYEENTCAISHDSQLDMPESLAYSFGTYSDPIASMGSSYMTPEDHSGNFGFISYEQDDVVDSSVAIVAPMHMGPFSSGEDAVPVASLHALSAVSSMISAAFAQSPRTPDAEYMPQFVDMAWASQIFKFTYRSDASLITPIEISAIRPALPNIVNEWKCNVRKTLQEILAEFPETDDLLDLAKTFFECSDCQRLLQYPEVIAHGCARSASRLSPSSTLQCSEFEWYEQEVHRLAGTHAWSGNTFRVARILPRIKQIIQLFEKDPDTAYRYELDRMDVRLCCLPPGTHDDMWVASWSQAVALKHDRMLSAEFSHEDTQQVLWRLATEREVEEAAEQESRRYPTAFAMYIGQPYWCCSMCDSRNGRFKSAPEIEAHLRYVHKINNATIDAEYIYLHPEGKPSMNMSFISLPS